MTLPPPPLLEPTQPPRSSSAWGRLLAWGGLGALLLLVLLALVNSQQGPVRVGDQVPDFSLTTFADPAGATETISLADLRGRVVVLNFWASWCKPCEQEAAELEAAWKHYAPSGEVVFLGVDYVDTEPEARGYLAKFGLTYPNGPDLRTRISQIFRIRGVPETYFIDRQGRLAAVQIGPFTSLEQILQTIDPLLAQPLLQQP
jgi:cytochrome c biogenesis protein CcmG/thiol:disulfide interchange protein DsbE